MGEAVAAEALGAGPAVVVAHSLGTVVSYETLHEHLVDIPP
jgi:pimeloyl-ACP methyl ester carboxylesterase